MTTAETDAVDMIAIVENILPILMHQMMKSHRITVMRTLQRNPSIEKNALKVKKNNNTKKNIARLCFSLDD